MNVEMGKAVRRSYRADRSVTQHTLARGTLRRIATFAQPYLPSLAVFLVLVVLDALIGAVSPLILKEIIDRAIGRHDVALAEALALVVAGLALLDAAVSLGSRWISSRVGEGLICDMRVRVFEHLQRQPLAFFTRAQTGALISRVNSDVLGAQSAFTGTLSSVLSNVLSVALVLSAMFFLSWQITLVSLAILPIFVLPARLLGGRLRDITREEYQLNAQTSNTMNERFNVAGALLVKLFGRPEQADEDFRAAAGRVRDIGVTESMYGGLFTTSLTLTAALATALVYGIGGRLSAEGALDIGTLVALTTFLARLYGPLTALSNVNVDVMTALVSFERVFEILDLEPAVCDPAQPKPLLGAASLEFDHVTFRYPAPAEVSLGSLESVARLDERAPADVLHDVSFTVGAGQLVALVGPSGAGKTTISQLVSRLYDPQQGTVRIAGVDAREGSAADLRDTVGVVTQDAHLFHDTVRANLRFAKPNATEPEMWEALEAAQVAPLVRALEDGLDTLVGDRGYRLSGGEKQRLALARILLKAPPIVVLDEATAHLDSGSEHLVQEALSTALRGRTSLVIAHRLSTIRAADEILVVDGGRIVERGTHTELLSADGMYAVLYQTQYAETAPADPPVTARRRVCAQHLACQLLAGEPAAG